MHVNISIVSSDPVRNILFFEIIAKLKASEKYSEVIRINGSMSELIDMSKYFKHTEILKTHELLFERLNSFDALNLSFTNPYDCMLYIVTDFGQRVVQSISKVSLCVFEMGSR
jgi:hypothetical protein